MSCCLFVFFDTLKVVVKPKRKKNENQNLSQSLQTSNTSVGEQFFSPLSSLTVYSRGEGDLPFSAPTSCLFDSSTFTPRPNFTVHNPGSVWTHEPLTFCANGSLTSRRRLPACACLIWSLPPLVSVRARSRGASVFAGQVFSSTH